MADPFNLIWMGRSLELADMCKLETHNWVGATQDDIIRYIRSNRKLRQSYSGQADNRLCAIMMVKDEADIISHNIWHLYRVGFRRLLVLDNGSSDNTPKILRHFQHSLDDMEILIVDDISMPYMQSTKTTALMQFAKAFWPGLQWIFPIDADEFLCTEDGIGTLSSIPKEVDVLVLQKVNHFLLPITNDLNFGDPLGRMPIRSDMGKQPPKAALRAMNDVIITQGNHDVRSETGRSFHYDGGFKYGLYLREFQNRSFEQFKRKVINGGRAVRAAESAGAFLGGDHWKHWFSIYEQHGDDRLLEIFKTSSVENGEGMIFDPIVPIRRSDIGIP
jgi:glycosyltransferase involved in cell wall biosynthesis